MSSPVRARVAVVIVDYHAFSFIQECVSSLVSPLIDSITIVDNSCAPSETELLHGLERSDGRIKVVTAPSNLGFARGSNLGVDQTVSDGSDIIWALNPDTRVAAGAVEQLVRCLDAGVTDIISPLITTGDGATIWFAGGEFDTRRGVSWHWRKGESVDGVRDGLLASDFITGAAPMMYRRTWSVIGGFPDDLFLYWEDALFSRRARELGFRMHVTPEARVWHAQGGSTGEPGGGNGPGYYYYNQRNRILTCGRPGNLLLGAGARETARLLLAPLVRDSKPRAPKFWASVRGIVDGVRGRHGRGPY
ncbi:glycosyltransferase family 2 protein [Nocardioides pantholopis]|uniref:glycosyltransferase family 2 protein n=1 Tax=Nocardioides pantholopis TaxID=2483798 RepID=UPI000F094F2F